MMMVMSLDRPLEGIPAAIRRTEAIVLMLMFCIVIYITALDLMHIRRADPLLADIEGSSTIVTPQKGRLRWAFVIVGFVLLFVGGELTVRNGVAFANQIGISTAVVGLLVVAVGTSMPELVTSIIAAMRGEPDLALGNVIGSNIFNSLLVLPVSGIITQIPVPAGGVGDLVVSWLLAASLIPLFLLGSAVLGRGTGAIFLSIYIGYAVYRVLGA